MRNLLALLGLLVILFAAVGWYCGWYTLNISRGQEGNLQIKTDVDTQKVSQDSSTFFNKVGQLINEKTDKSGQPTNTPVNMPGPADANSGNPPDGGGLPMPPKPPVGTGTQQ